MSEVLVLNRNFYAIAVTGWQRAISLLYLDHARVVDEGYRTYDFGDWLDASRSLESETSAFVRTPNHKIAIPEVISLRLFGKVPKREVTFSRRNLLLHYGWRCCYCGERFASDELNLDHILPKSRGGGTSWGNVVVSCIPCNKRKAEAACACPWSKLQLIATNNAYTEAVDKNQRRRVNIAPFYDISATS